MKKYSNLKLFDKIDCHIKRTLKIINSDFKPKSPLKKSQKISIQNKMELNTQRVVRMNI